MTLLRRFRLILVPALLAPMVAFAGSQDRAVVTSGIEGTVTGPTGLPLPGATVVLEGEEAAAASPRSTTELGRFAFEDLSPDVYVLTVSFPGFVDFISEPIVIEASSEVIALTVALVASFSESVTIQESLQEATNEPDDPAEFRIEALDMLPLLSDRFQEALPLIPGVVRDPDGRLSFNGARPSESVLLVNGANVTDPITGEFAVEIPLKAIDAVEVYSIPYSAEFGRARAAVANVKTRRGQDEWKVDASNLFPKPRFRGGTLMGIGSAVPQVQVSGPIAKGKAWISQGIAVRFLRSRVFDLPMLGGGEGDERILEGFDTFTQFDWRLNEAHSLTTTFSYFPVEIDNQGLDALTPEPATPDFSTWGWNGAISFRSQFSTTLWESILSVKSFDVASRPKSDGPARLTPEGLRDNYFNVLERASTRWEFTSKATHALQGISGRHVLKVGGNISRTEFSGVDRSLPIEVRGQGGDLLRRIDFVGDGLVGGNDLQLALFVQDRWRPNSTLGIDLGLRYDYDRIADEHQLSPRLNFAYSPDRNGRTIVRAGWGVFFDHVFLHSASYERIQDRVETSFDGRGDRSTTVFRHRISPEGLKLPRNVTWNIGVNQELSSELKLRVNFRQRRGTDDMRVDRLEGGGVGTLLLSSSGGSIYREFEVTLRGDLLGHGELFGSYVRSNAEGELNNFGELYTNVRNPIILEAANTLLDHDVPNRLLLWGVCEFPHGISVAPGLEWRSGFPYTEFSEDYNLVGERNRGGRFPSFFSLDLRVMKKITVKGKKAQVGIQFFNLGGHRNPRDVVSNVSSLRFGEFLNSADMRVSVRIRFGF